MSEIPPERATMDDELHRAYARAHALVDGSHGPSAAVRANVLAQVVRPAAAAPPLAPVAAPVAPVGPGRADAGNRPSWRLRSGAAIGVALVVGALSWRWEASRQGGGETVVAAAPQAPAHADTAPRMAARGKSVLPPEPKLAVAQAAPERAAQAPPRAARVATAPMLLSADARPQAPSLAAAADRGDVAALKTLLAAPSVQVDAPDPAGATALLHAVRARQVAAARLLLAAGADPDRADRGGTTPRVAAEPEIAALLPAPR